MTTAIDIRPKKRRGRKGAVGKLLPMLTDVELRALLERDVRRANQKLPPPDRILTLAKELSYLRLMLSESGRRVLTKSQTDLQHITAALSEIIRLSPTVMEKFPLHIAVIEGRLIGLSKSDLPESELNDEVTSSHFAIRELKEQQLQFLEMMHVCEELIETDCYGLFGNKAPIYSWHDISHRLVTSFQLAMRPTNPTLRMGLSKGPVPRFIAAVVPHITGERPNGDQIGKYLRDNPPPSVHRQDRDNPTE